MSGETLATTISIAAGCFSLSACCKICVKSTNRRYIQHSHYRGPDNSLLGQGAILEPNQNHPIGEACLQSKNCSPICFFDYWPNAPFQIGDFLKPKDEGDGRPNKRYYVIDDEGLKRKKMSKKKRNKFIEDYPYELEESVESWRRYFTVDCKVEPFFNLFLENWKGARVANENEKEENSDGLFVKKGTEGTVRSLEKDHCNVIFNNQKESTKVKYYFIERKVEPENWKEIKGRIEKYRNKSTKGIISTSDFSK